jgi:hypothetical protein
MAAEILSIVHMHIPQSRPRVKFHMSAMTGANFVASLWLAVRIRCGDPQDQGPQ